MKNTWRKYCSGWASIWGARFKHRPLEVELHHYPNSLRQTGFMPMENSTPQTLPGFNQPGERRQWLAVFAIRVCLPFVALLRWAENPLHFRVVVEEREVY